MTQKKREEERRLKIAKLIIENGIVDITGDFNRALRYDECIEILAHHLDDYYGGWEGREAFMFEIKDLPTDCGFEENISYNLNEMKFYLVEDENEIEELGIEGLKEHLEGSNAISEYPLEWIKEFADRFTINRDEHAAFDNFLQDLKDNHFPRYSGHEKYPNYPTFNYHYDKGFEESYEESIKEKVEGILLPFSDDIKAQLLDTLRLEIFVEYILDYVPQIIPNFEQEVENCTIPDALPNLLTLLNSDDRENRVLGANLVERLCSDEDVDSYCIAQWVKENYIDNPESSFHLKLDDLTYNDLDYGDEGNFFEFLVQNADEYGQLYHFDIEMVFDYFGGVDYKEWAYYESQFKSITDLFWADDYDDDGSQDKQRELVWLTW